MNGTGFHHTITSIFISEVKEEVEIGRYLCQKARPAATMRIIPSCSTRTRSEIQSTDEPVCREKICRYILRQNFSNKTNNMNQGSIWVELMANWLTGSVLNSQPTADDEHDDGDDGADYPRFCDPQRQVT